MLLKYMYIYSIETHYHLVAYNVHTHSQEHVAKHRHHIFMFFSHCFQLKNLVKPDRWWPSLVKQEGWGRDCIRSCWREQGLMRTGWACLYHTLICTLYTCCSLLLDCCCSLPSGGIAWHIWHSEIQLWSMSVHLWSTLRKIAETGMHLWGSLCYLLRYFLVDIWCLFCRSVAKHIMCVIKVSQLVSR